MKMIRSQVMKLTRIHGALSTCRSLSSHAAAKTVKTVDDIPGAFDASNEITVLFANNDNNPFKAVNKIVEQYPNDNLYKCSFYGVPAVMPLDIHVSHTAASLEVKNKAKYMIGPAWQEYFGHHTLFDKTGENHTKRKKEITSTLSPKTVSNPIYRETIAKDLNQLFETMNNQANDYVDFLQEFRIFTWRAGLKLLLSSDVVDQFEKENPKLGKECAELGSATAVGLYTVDIESARKDPQCPFSEGLKAKETLKSILDPMIDESRKLYENSKLDKESCVFKTFDQTPLLSNVDGKQEDILPFDYINLLMFATTDTTASTMCSLLYSIWKYPNAFNVLKTIVKNGEYDLFDHNDYLHWYVQETLRLMPIAHGFARMITDDVELDNTVLTSGIAVYLPSHYFHHCEKYWGKNAFDFDPTRFDHEKWNHEARKAYMPFGKGNRVCGGMNFAILSLKTFLVSVIEHGCKIDIDPNTVDLNDWAGLGRAKYNGKLTIG